MESLHHKLAAVMTAFNQALERNVGMAVEKAYTLEDEEGNVIYCQITDLAEKLIEGVIK